MERWMEQVGEKFRTRAFKFPGLTSGCTLDWFQPWPREALVAVAHHFLKDFDLLRQTDMAGAVEISLGSIQESVAETAKEYFNRSARIDFILERKDLSKWWGGVEGGREGLWILLSKKSTKNPRILRHQGSLASTNL